MRPLIAWILHQIALLYQVEERLREAQAGPALREALRASESRMIHRRLHRFIIKLSKRGILPQSKLGKAINYALNQWQYLEGYLTDGRVEIDTGRKCAILYTIVENCRRLKIDVREYLTEVLTRLPGMQANEAHRLTPAAWHKAQSRKRHQMAA